MRSWRTGRPRTARSQRTSLPGLAPLLQGEAWGASAYCPRPPSRRQRPPTWPSVLSPRPRLVPASPSPLGSSAPVRTAKAERRHQERLRVQSPELPVPERALSPAERRALEAEKRALWRAAR